MNHKSELFRLNFLLFLSHVILVQLLSMSTRFETLLKKKIRFFLLKCCFCCRFVSFNYLIMSVCLSSLMDFCSAWCMHADLSKSLTKRLHSANLCVFFPLVSFIIDLLCTQSNAINAHLHHRNQSKSD